MLELISLSIALAMDALACSISQSISLNRETRFKSAIVLALTFGFFQALMPLIGYFLGVSFSNLVSSFDHWIAFILLTIIALNMLKDVLKNEENPVKELNLATLFTLGIATSIDAFAVGISLPLLNVSIYSACAIIGIITFIISFIGSYIGQYIGKYFAKIAQICGAIILIVIGTKILIEHLFL